MPMSFPPFEHSFYHPCPPCIVSFIAHWFSCVISLLIGFSFLRRFFDSRRRRRRCFYLHPWNNRLFKFSPTEFSTSNGACRLRLYGPTLLISAVTCQGWKIESMLALFHTPPTHHFHFLYPPSAHLKPPPTLPPIQ
jgi:hypothetical protein